MTNLIILIAIGLALLVDCGFSTPEQTNQGSCPTMPVLSCPPSANERGPPGFPGKRGPKGDHGFKGEQGVKGEKGQADDSTIAIERIEAELRELRDKALAEIYTELQEIRSNQSAKLQELRDSAFARINTESQEFKDKFNRLDNFIYSGFRNNCDDLYQQGVGYNGFYHIIVGNQPIEIYCDFQVDGHNWLVFQRRTNGKVDFYRNWDEYVKGFGDKNGEFWLGLEALHAITNERSYQLQVDLEDWDGNTYYADYSTFVVGDSTSNYRLSVNGHSGNITHSMNRENNQTFSTKDRDNDLSNGNCAVTYHGAWWYRNCYNANLNGRYYNEGPQSSQDGIVWERWRSHYSMKRVQMKLRPN